jgi:phosphoribosylamine-glycine ligase
MLKFDSSLMESTLQNINTKFMNAYQMNKDDRGPISAKMKLPSSHFQGHNIWILKATGFNRGRGIHVFNKLEELMRLIKEYTDGTSAEAAGNQQVATKIISKNIKETKEGTTTAQ